MIEGSIDTTNAYLGANIITVAKLSSTERKLFEGIIDCLSDTVNIDRLVIQQLSSEYKTVVYDTWYNDFLRFSCNPEGIWLSIHIYPDMARDFETDSRFSSQENKNRTFWQCHLNSPSDIANYADAIRRSCLNYARYNPKADPSGESAWDKHKGAQSKIASALTDIWRNAEDVKSPAFLNSIKELGFQPLSSRSITIAGTTYHKDAQSLASGTVLRCELEPNNPYDSNAIAFTNNSAAVIGYVQKTCTLRDSILESLKTGQHVYAIVSGRRKGKGNRQDKIQAFLLLKQ